MTKLLWHSGDMMAAIEAAPNRGRTPYVIGWECWCGAWNSPVTGRDGVTRVSSYCWDCGEKGR